MHNRLFTQLATDSELSRAQAFSQLSWLKHHYSANHNTLCSALTYFWLNEKLLGRSPLPQLAAPNSELLQNLSRLQALSYYPNFPKNFSPGKREQILLQEKYGTRDWKKIKLHVNKDHQGDYVLYDLSRMFFYDSARIIQFKARPRTLQPLKQPCPGSAILGVFRYLNNGQPDGHRIAYYFDQKKQHHFFDPNAGEVIESSDVTFYKWLNTFLLHNDYRKFKSSHDHFLTLYELSNIHLCGTHIKEAHSNDGYKPYQ